MIKRLAPLFSLVLALGCGTPTEVVARFEFGEAFELAVGQTALSSDGNTTVTFARVITDSRCPSDAVCVWAGEAIVELAISSPLPDGVDPALANVAEPRVDVTVGAPAVIHGDRRVEVLELTRGSTEPGRLVVPNARLRIDTLP